MLSIWIIHRDPKARAAIARISGAGERAVLASPTDRVLEGADAPAVVVLGLSGDFEVELDFVHRHASRLADCDWILLAPAADLGEARRLFDTLPSHVLAYPPEPRDLRRALRASIQQRHADPLSARQGRADLQDRFARWFGDLELPELMRVLDPRLARVPVLIHGEEGTGRGLLARYVHVSTGRNEDTFVQVTCREQTRPEDLIRQMSLGEPAGRSSTLTFYFEDVDRLHTSLQHRLRDWIEFGLPEGGVRRHGHRFMASASGAGELDDAAGLDPRLSETLSGLTLSLPALRTRADHIPAFVVDTAGALARARGEHPRRFGDEALSRLAAHPWPGNLHELEAVVVRTMAFTSANPIEAIHLRFPSDVPWLDEVDTYSPASHGASGRARADVGPDVERPTAFPDPLTGRVTAPTLRAEPIDDLDRRATSGDEDDLETPRTMRFEPIDDLADLDPGAAPGHEDDLELGRVATLGGAPVPPEAIEDDGLGPVLSELTLEIDDGELFADLADDEEGLFPEDDLEDIEEDGDIPAAELVDDTTEALIGSQHEAQPRSAFAEGTFVAELLPGEAAEGEAFAVVELIEDPETTTLDPFAATAELEPSFAVEPDELRPEDEIVEPRELRPDHEQAEPTAHTTINEINEPLETVAVAELDEPLDLLPGVEPLDPPVRPFPDAGEGDPLAASLAEDALPFGEPLEVHTPDNHEPLGGHTRDDHEPLDVHAHAHREPGLTEPASVDAGRTDPRLNELVGAIAHEVRNPLVSIRTFSELLPEHYDDPEFRDHFRELVVKDVLRIDRVVTRLQSLAEGQRKPEAVDMARLLDRLLDERRPLIQSRRLLVLKELDHTSPLVLADAEQVEDAISGLIDRAIEQASERGDVYLASKYDDGGRGGRPSVRVLIRHTRASSVAGASQATQGATAASQEIMLDLVLAKRLIEAQGGDLAVDEAEAGESVIVINLPAA